MCCLDLTPIRATLLNLLYAFVTEKCSITNPRHSALESFKKETYFFMKKFYFLSKRLYFLYEYDYYN